MLEKLKRSQTTHNPERTRPKRREDAAAAWQPMGVPSHHSPLNEPWPLGTPISQERTLAQFIWALGSAGSGQHTYTNPSNKDTMNRQGIISSHVFKPPAHSSSLPSMLQGASDPNQLPEHSPQRLAGQYQGSLWGSGLCFKDKTLPEQENSG